jgi:aminoglycoside 6'-N-acetyltransferase
LRFLFEKLPRYHIHKRLTGFYELVFEVFGNKYGCFGHPKIQLTGPIGVDTVDECFVFFVAESVVVRLADGGEHIAETGFEFETKERFFANFEKQTYENVAMKPVITLRPATIADLAVLQHWDQQPHVIESDLDGNWDWETELLYEPAWRVQLMAELDGRPLGFVQIIDPAQEETHYWGDVPQGLRAIDVWIGEAADLGKGYGTTMMQQAINQCFDNESVTAILIDPLATNTRAHRFYERLGFRFVEQKLLGKDESNCFIFRLSREEYLDKQDFKAHDCI